MVRSFMNQNTSLVGEGEGEGEADAFEGCSPTVGNQDLTPETARVIEAIGPITIQLRKKLASASVQLVEAGMLLLRAKEMLAHGKFQPWLRENFKMSGKTANRLMSLAKMVRKYELAPETISKLMSLELNIIYEIAAKSTPEEIQRQILYDLALDQVISYEEVKGLKKQSRHLDEEPRLTEPELRKFLRLLKLFSQWYDEHQAQLQVLSALNHSELKNRLECYALQLKAASDIVDGLIAQNQTSSPDVIYIFPEVSTKQALDK